MRAVKSVVAYPVGSYARISYQAEALFAKTIYPGCHFSCRLVKSDRAYPLSVHIVA